MAEGRETKVSHLHVCLSTSVPFSLVPGRLSVGELSSINDAVHPNMAKKRVERGFPFPLVLFLFSPWYVARVLFGQ